MQSLAKLHKASLGLLVIVCAISVTHCGSPEPTEQTVKEVISGQKCRPESKLTYDNFGKGFMLTWCGGCHTSNLKSTDRAGAPIEMNFGSQALVKKHLQRIYTRAAIKGGSMPPSAPVPPEERARLAEWLRCNAP